MRTLSAHLCQDFFSSEICVGLCILRFDCRKLATSLCSGKRRTQQPDNRVFRFSIQVALLLLSFRLLKQVFADICHGFVKRPQQSVILRPKVEKYRESSQENEKANGKGTWLRKGCKGLKRGSDRTFSSIQRGKIT